MSAMLVRGIRAGKGNSACKNMEILIITPAKHGQEWQKAGFFLGDARAVERAIWVKRRGELPFGSEPIWRGFANPR